jgi:hypothetical protein
LSAAQRQSAVEGCGVSSTRTCASHLLCAMTSCGCVCMGRVGSPWLPYHLLAGFWVPFSHRGCWRLECGRSHMKVGRSLRLVSVGFVEAPAHAALRLLQACAGRCRVDA